MNNRKEGYYWVLRRGAMGWEVARWSEAYGAWFMIGQRSIFPEREMDEIDETPIKRNNEQTD